MNPLRIILIGALPPPAMGPTLATELILESPHLVDFDLRHLDTSDHRPLDTLGAIDFRNFWLAGRSYLLLVWLLVRARPDIVYVPISQTTVGYLKDSVYILIAKTFRRRVVCHLRGSNFRNWLNGCGAVLRRYVHWVQSLVDAQIVLGEGLRELFAGLLPAERIHVVPNGKDLPTCSRRNDASSPISILFIANLVRAKGILTALEGAAAAHARMPCLELRFAGEWAEAGLRAEVEEFIERTSLPCHYLGPIDAAQKQAAFARADVFLFPSTNEGHPWVIVEAMAAGLPIIATDVGAIPDSVIHELNGFIVDSGHPDQIADRLINLAQSPQTRGRMGAESRRLQEERFSEKAMTDALATVFRSISPT